jgi:phosphomannomutase
MLGRYVDHLMRFAEGLRPKKLVCDAANGMAGYILPQLAERLKKRGIELTPMFWELDGNFPNHEANPLKPEVMEVAAKAVRAALPKYHAAASFDGDADRCAFVDETGTPIPNDLMTAVLARWLLRKHPGSAMVYDLRSSWVVPETIAASGGRALRMRVGHSYIKETMRKEKAFFGGELSGHYYWQEHFYCDSALVTLVRVLDLLSEESRPLSELVRDLRRYHATGEINFEVADKAGAMAGLKKRFGKEATRMDELDGITIEYGSVAKKPWWWFNVRPSNTEPLLRLNLEASDAALRDEKKEMLVGILGKPVH